jgi:hypothetical protein
MLSRGTLLRNGARGITRLVAIEVVQGTGGSEMMALETRNIEIEVATESETEGATSTEMTTATILALRERAGIETEKETDTIKMTTGDGKSDIESHSICIISQALIPQRHIGESKAAAIHPILLSLCRVRREGTCGFPPDCCSGLHDPILLKASFPCPRGVCASSSPSMLPVYQPQ